MYQFKLCLKKHFSQSRGAWPNDFSNQSCATNEILALSAVADLNLISGNPARPAHKKMRAFGQRALRIRHNVAES